MKLYDKLCSEAKWAIIEALKNNDVHNIDDIHNDIFNMDYYDDINPNNDADRAIALERFGSKEEVFEGIGRVYTYEMDNFGTVYTKMNNPASVLNMLYYIAGEEVLYSIDDFCELYGEITDELATTLIEKYEKTDF